MTKSVFTKEYKFMLEQLVKARKKAGLSQRELSEKLNMPSSFVGKYELGERRLDIIEVLQIAMVLNINTSRLIYEIEKVMKQ
jgi:DNA-binding helix-turn-helix protein